MQIVNLSPSSFNRSKKLILKCTKCLAMLDEEQMASEIIRIFLLSKIKHAYDETLNLAVGPKIQEGPRARHTCFQLRTVQ